MRILLDQNIPLALRRSFSPHTVVHAIEVGWDTITNGELIAAAERERFDVLVTADQNLKYQQNLVGRQIALVVLSTNNWETLRAHLPDIIAAIG